MDVFLTTDRLVLRCFTMDDEDNLVDLDGDPEVMHFITGGLPTPRTEIRNDYLPAYLDYYRRYPGYGFWVAEERETSTFLGWFHFRPGPDRPTSPSWATACVGRPGARATGPKARAP